MHKIQIIIILTDGMMDCTLYLRRKLVAQLLFNFYEAKWAVFRQFPKEPRSILEKDIIRGGREPIYSTRKRDAQLNHFSNPPNANSNYPNLSV